MSKNSELVLASYEAWNRDKVDAWLETLHPDVEFDTSGVFPDFDPVYRGLVVEIVSRPTAEQAREVLRQRQPTTRSQRP